MTRPFLNRLVLAGALALTGAACAACGGGATPNPTEETSMTVGYGHGSMEKALDRMVRMRGDMMHALDERIERRAWRPAPNEDGVSIAGCNDERSDTVALRTYTFPSVYSPDKWHEAASLVEEVGRRYGFDVVRRTVDRPGNLEITGLAPDGGSYTFGMVSATTLTVTTGCYRWAESPGPDAWLTIDPTP